MKVVRPRLCSGFVLVESKMMKNALVETGNFDMVKWVHKNGLCLPTTTDRGTLHQLDMVK